jgi:tetratricopeptide (TPR) repeat protein
MKSKFSETRLIRTGLVLIAVCLAIGSIHGESDADRLVYQGIDAYKAHDYDLAISKFTEAIKLDPKNCSARNNRGLSYREKGDFDAAIADFNSALKIKSDWSVYYNRGLTYYEKRKSDSAIADFSKALKLSSKEPNQRVNCLIGRARAYFDKEEAEPAMKDLNAAIKLDQRRSDAYVLRGVLYKVGHEYQKSLDDYETAIGLDPTDARAYDVEAYLLSVCPTPKYRDAKKAISYATKACELTEWKAAGPIETLAAAYAEAGQFDDAIKWQTKAAQIDPKAVDERRLALYQQRQPFRDINRVKQEQPFANLNNIGDKLAIKVGQKTAARFEISNGKLAGLKIVDANGEQPGKNPDCVWLDFRHDKRGYVLFIWHSLPKTLEARCLARLKDYDTYFETDILPVPVKIVSPEIWKEPIEEVVLFDFKLSDKKGPAAH